METQDALDKLRQLQGLMKDISRAAESYQKVAQALSDPTGTRIEGYKAPSGYGGRCNLTESPPPLEELKESLFQIQWLCSELEANVDSIPDENVKSMITQELRRPGR